jgi:hypothetical protein
MNLALVTLSGPQWTISHQRCANCFIDYMKAEA